MKESNEKSVYAFLIGITLGIAGGAYLYSRKNSKIRNRIEEEILDLYENNKELNEIQLQEVNNIKTSLLNIISDISDRIKESMKDGKEDNWSIRKN